MDCPVCNHRFPDNSGTCPECGFNFNQINWITVGKTYHPQDIIIESLLNSANIPVRLIKKEVYGFPVAIGPLAEVKVLVPDKLADTAKHIIDEVNQSSESESESPWEES